MKANTLLAVCLLICTTAFTQSKEFYIEAGSGLFSFTGKTPVKHQNAFDWIIAREPYTVPFGKNSGFSATVSGNAKFISRTKWVTGGSFALQSLASRSTIDSLHLIGDPAATVSSSHVNGHSTLRINCVTLCPFAGRRLNIQRIKIDITTGLEVALVTGSVEKIKMKTDYSFNNKRNIDTRDVDIRWRIAAELMSDKFMFSVRYLKGLMNYYHQYVGGQPEAYSQFFGVGVGYRLR